MRRIHLGQLRVIPRKIGTHQIAIPLSAASSPFILSSVGGRRHGMLRELDATRSVADMHLPGFRLHPLKGELKCFWAVTVRANWRVIFRFAGPDAFDVDYVDYH